MAKKRSSTPIEAISHKDRRVNIPTEELRDFVAEEEKRPQTMLYPRDPSLDPQLVWKGKDEQDREDLAVPVVPIYIQEKIKPQALINALPRIEQPGGSQIDLFSDFNGGPADFEQKVEFYQHEQNWTNRLILGDSLLVMTSLAEKEGLKGKVQTIYLDPPYGIKFGSNWQVSTRKRDVGDKAEDATRQPEQVRAFRDTWKLGINSFLAYLRDRLVVARELLTETGSIFVQIGDENVHLVRCVLDEVLGSENFIAIIRFRKKTMPLGGLFLERMGDFIVWYSKNKDVARSKYRQLLIRQNYEEDFHWNNFELSDGSRIKLTKAQIEKGQEVPQNAKRFRLVSLWPASFNSNAVFPVPFRGKEWWPAEGQCWPTSPEGMNKLIWANQIEPEGNYLRLVLYLEGAEYSKLTTDWGDTIGARDQKYVVETSPKVIERCILMTTDPGDLVLDPTCGSGTTAYVAEQWGRRWITCDTSRVALALARTRLMAAKYTYYLLADSPEGIEKEKELTGKTPPEYKTSNDIRRGFIYERVLSAALESITNNPEIREGLTREQIDAAVLRNTNTVELYDKPYPDNKRVRVCGPFSVESLSPHRVLSTADENQDGTVTEQEAHKQQDFVSMILDNLKKAGVQNTRKDERLTFDRLDPFAGKWIHATGDYTDADGKTRRVAVSIGPEHGTVGPQQVKEAAKEAVQGVGFDLLIVCGFAFDPHVSEEAKRYGSLTVLPAKMNPDLAMGDELLKKTGAGNLFMVFGEPDVEITRQKDGQLVVEIKGVDVYDPTTGQVRSSSTDDIACWFIDTEYNGESFFVRHAYFTGAEEPYDKLKRALRAEIDEAAWNSLYSTVSRPFAKPESGKIAVKVINHYGDEVLKVFEV
ncbi:site-specific DNA-methyltransferase [bacterium]|nr:site-specific DNA-methyltransferase [bacterium]